MAVTQPVVGVIKVEWTPARPMSVTELAHWRYRVKALEPDVAATRQTVAGFAFTALYGTYDEKVHQQWYDRLQFEEWLLEEAKYMVELGELTQP